MRSQSFRCPQTTLSICASVWLALRSNGKARTPLAYAIRSDRTHFGFAPQITKPPQTHTAVARNEFDRGNHVRKQHPDFL